MCEWGGGGGKALSIEVYIIMNANCKNEQNVCIINEVIILFVVFRVLQWNLATVHSHRPYRLKINNDIKVWPLAKIKIVVWGGVNV